MAQHAGGQRTTHVGGEGEERLSAARLIPRASVIKRKILPVRGLTFDDVLLVPAYSDFLPNEADVRTNLTGNIALGVPLLSAAMDTVTESAMAIALARQGGLGVIHRNLSPEEQAEEVRKVKRAESETIYDPFTLTSKHTLSDAVQLMRAHNISGIPIVDSLETRRLAGIITSRDLRFEEDLSVRISERMISGRRLIRARMGISAAEAQSILKKHRIEKLPLVDKDGVLRGLITVKDITKKWQFPNAAKDESGRLLAGAAVGTGEQEFARAGLLVSEGVDVLVVDTAHGHSKRVLEMVAKLKVTFPSVQVIGGNVATSEGALALIESGADAVKVGIGPGSICTTRIIAGIGVPQITAIMEVARVTKHYGVPLIADGGIIYSGDITKALAAGADSVMLGNIFAGSEEGPGARVIFEGRAYKTYRGMGSEEAMKKRGGKDRYGQTEGQEPIPEGIEGRVPYKGIIAEIVYQIVGGIRAGMAYCGARTIKELWENGQFIQITQASLQESHPHDIAITRGSRNYPS